MRGDAREGFRARARFGAGCGGGLSKPTTETLRLGARGLRGPRASLRARPLGNRLRWCGNRLLECRLRRRIRVGTLGLRGIGVRAGRGGAR